MKKFDPTDAEETGRALAGFGVNLLVSDVENTVRFLTTVLDFSVVTSSRDYALLSTNGQWFMLHGDHTYGNNPLPSLLPEFGARGGGLELRLYELDPDQAENKARENNYQVLMGTADKPHGLRECFLLDPDGYCWVPSVKKNKSGVDH